MTATCHTGRSAQLYGSCHTLGGEGGTDREGGGGPGGRRGGVNDGGIQSAGRVSCAAEDFVQSVNLVKRKRRIITDCYGS